MIIYSTYLYIRANEEKSLIVLFLDYIHIRIVLFEIRKYNFKYLNNKKIFFYLNILVRIRLN